MGISGRNTGFVAGGLSGLTALLFLWPVAFRGWIPADEGALGLAAVRVLDGGWPHVDYYDVYSGLQAVVHAGAFTALGVSIRSLRIVWLGVAVIAAVSLHFLLRDRLGSRLAAGASTGLVVFAFAMYPASMPTWWNLSLGLAAISLAYHGWARRSSGLVAVAGMVTGLSVLVKTTGGALIAIAIVLWLISTSYGRRHFVVSTATVAALATIAAMVAPVLSLTRVVFLGVPAAAAVVLVWKRSGRSSVDPCRRHLPWVYSAGVLGPVSVFVATYAVAGRFDSLVQGWLVAPASRLELVTEDISLAWIVPGLIMLTVLVLVARTPFAPTLIRLSVGFVFLVLVWLDWARVGQALFGFLVVLPLAFAAGAVSSRGRPEGGADDDHALLGTVSALVFILVSIPWWGPYYIAYSIPMLGMSLLLFIPRHHHGFAVAGIWLVAGVFLVRSLGGFTVGPTAINDPVTYVQLESSRAGIAVPEVYAYYDDLAERVAALAGESAVYAGPDAPEVPFLAGVVSATPALYEVLDPRWEYGVIAGLAADGSVVVLNLDPNPSPPVPSDIRREVLDHNQNHEKIGSFLVTWPG